MLTRVHLVLCAAAVSMLAAGCATVPNPQAQALRQLEHDSARRPQIRIRNGVPAIVVVDVPVRAGLPDDPVIHALSFLERYKDLYQLWDPRQQLFLHRAKLDATEQHLFFRQKHNDIPVFGGELAVHMVGGRIVLTNGHYLPTIPPLPGPTLDAADAGALALAAMAGASPAIIGVPRLMYFDNSLLGGGRPETHLAWRISVRGVNKRGVAASWTLFVDAHDGRLLLSIDQSPTDAADKDFIVETVNSTTSSSCWGGPGETADDEWFDEDGPNDDYPGLGGDAFGDGQKAFGLTHQVYDYFFSDSGGVHINSGIPNKAAFLITDGGQHNGFIVNGIGRAKAQRLYYDVLVSGVTSAAQFSDARTAYSAFHWMCRNRTVPVCVCTPMKRGSVRVDGRPRSGDCGSPVKWNRLMTCPFNATVKSDPSTVISN